MEEAPQSQEMIDMDEELTKIAVAPGKISGATLADKLQYIKKKMAKIPSYKYTRYENHTEEEILVALFGKYDKAEQACTTSLVEGGNTFFRKVQATDTKEALSRTICIWDISTDLTKKDIATANSCLSSTVTLHNMDDYQELNQKWSILYKNYHMRIFPYFGTREAKENRNKYTATIANLPENITAKDLEHIIKQVNAQTCYIPKKDNSNYKRLAIFSFHNQEDRKQATNQNFQLSKKLCRGGQTLPQNKQLCIRQPPTNITNAKRNLSRNQRDTQRNTANRHFDKMEQMKENSQSTTTKTINIDNNSDLIETQAQINQKINKMDETMEKLINTFIPDTPSTNSTHNTPTTLTQ
ncbi:11250_t:CDS:2 [Acaulospora morrowiae]|uniref:11250_t:CDS:1 n=1 Tax=Acaulospora morrowiae TaxID=94023 RepID=A0A9N9AS59_9GLOM|nr:11250_t:CDS:2 [Acaulospora morrowiae]